MDIAYFRLGKMNVLCNKSLCKYKACLFFCHQQALFITFFLSCSDFVFCSELEFYSLTLETYQVLSQRRQLLPLQHIMYFFFTGFFSLLPKWCWCLFPWQQGSVSAEMILSACRCIHKVRCSCSEEIYQSNLFFFCEQRC